MKNLVTRELLCFWAGFGFALTVGAFAAAVVIVFEGEPVMSTPPVKLTADYLGVIEAVQAEAQQLRSERNQAEAKHTDVFRKNVELEFEVGSLQKQLFEIRLGAARQRAAELVLLCDRHLDVLHRRALIYAITGVTISHDVYEVMNAERKELATVFHDFVTETQDLFEKEPWPLLRSSDFSYIRCMSDLFARDSAKEFLQEIAGLSEPTVRTQFWQGLGTEFTRGFVAGSDPRNIGRAYGKLFCALFR